VADAEQILEMTHISKSFPGVQALQYVSMSLSAGEVFAVVGENGAGKSTLARILAGIEPFDAGERVVGHNVTISYFAQHQAEELNPAYDVLQTVEEVATGDIRRRLRDLYYRCLDTGKVAVICSPVKYIPDEILREVAFIDLPRPDLKELEELLAAEGLVGAQIVCFVMKQAAGRLKPSDIPPDGNLRDTWFKYKGGLTNGGGFPSGHSASAFAGASSRLSRKSRRANHLNDREPGAVSTVTRWSLDTTWHCAGSRVQNTTNMRPGFSPTTRRLAASTYASSWPTISPSRTRAPSGDPSLCSNHISQVPSDASPTMSG